MESRVQELEKRLVVSLPTGYRNFLVDHQNSLLECALRFISPRSGVIDSLVTADEILQNDDQERLGIADKSLMHIGGDLMGGYLYLKVSDDGFGEIHFMDSMP
jgi:hypothetical protein